MIKSLLSKFKRDPDFIIGGQDNPYLLRWYIIPRNPFFNIYLHKFLRSDDERALHDHMYVNCSIVLKGNYIEHFKDGKKKWRRAGQVIFRKPSTPHRIELLRSYVSIWGDHSVVAGTPVKMILLPCWTLFITGPRVREWGFICPKGWRHWKDFTSPADKGTIGKGCD